MSSSTILPLRKDGHLNSCAWRWPRTPQACGRLLAAVDDKGIMVARLGAPGALAEGRFLPETYATATSRV